MLCSKLCGTSLDQINKVQNKNVKQEMYMFLIESPGEVSHIWEWNVKILFYFSISHSSLSHLCDYINQFYKNHLFLFLLTTHEMSKIFENLLHDLPEFIFSMKDSQQDLFSKKLKTY